MAHAAVTTFRNRQAVSLSNDEIELIIVLGGGHLASFKRQGQTLNVLWEPHWPSCDPSVRHMVDEKIYGDSLEGKLLSSICGHNLCVDVFGAHSDGEVEQGLTFHGEAGMQTWTVDRCVTTAHTCCVHMSVLLPLTQLKIERDITISDGSPVVSVCERMINLVGFERALGRSQHATLGKDFLSDGVTWSCNADRGMTWPLRADDSPQAFAKFKEFIYPNIPQNDGEDADWCSYPRHPMRGGLCTLRINPSDEHGYFSGFNATQKLHVAYRWQRESFPWLMTWEENKSRQNAPWNGKELTRGLEFSSYAYAISRRKNVKIGELLDTPCFEWLDAFETKETTFELALLASDQPVDRTEIFD